MLATIETGLPGVDVKLGVAEIATALQLLGSLYTTTLAIKGGVTNDFVAKTAAGLVNQLHGDVHALCPVIAILCECFALMTGGRVVLDKDDQVNIYPAKGCSLLLRGYFDGREQGWDRQDEKEEVG